jgi:hypothetical protein
MQGDLPDDPFIAPPAADESGGRASLTEGVKKALLAGVGALFLTEEGARRLARDWKLPKDVAAYIGQQASGAKDEILRLFGDEIRRFLESESVRREFWKGLAENAIEIHAEIRFRPDKDGAPRPEVSATAKPKRPRKKGKR